MVTETLTPGLIREFVLAGHGDLDKVRSLLSRHPQLLQAAYEWGPEDHESAIQAATRVSNRPIAVYLVEQARRLRSARQRCSGVGATLSRC